MNTFLLPPSPNWYKSSIMACAPDNTLIYGARQELIIIQPTGINDISDVKIITRAHSNKILWVDVNKKWEPSKKLVVSSGEDNLVKVFDIETLQMKKSNDCFVKESVKLVGAVFLEDGNTICFCNETGTICCWNIVSNEVIKYLSMLGKGTVTALAACPFSTRVAFGFNHGLVVVADLKSSGKVLYKLRGHEKEIVALSWCPAPVNIFPQVPSNRVSNKTLKLEAATTPDSEAVSPLCEKLSNIEISTETTPENIKQNVTSEEVSESTLNEENAEDSPEVPNKEENQSPKKPQKVNPWVNLKHVDDDEVPENFADINREVPPTENLFDDDTDDFLSQCESLKKKILQKDDDSPEKDDVVESSDVPATSKSERVILKSKKKGKDEQVMESEAFPGLMDHDDDLKFNLNNDEERTEEDDGEKKGKRFIPKVEPKDEEPRDEFLLASSAKENYINIWRAGTDGRKQTCIKLDNKGGGNRRYNNYRSRDKCWITICWISPKILLASSKAGELLQINVTSSKNSIRLIHNDHESSLFSICGPLTLSDNTNWLDHKPSNVWTTGIDRLILNTSLSASRKALSCYPTLGGAASCIVASPLDPSRLAVGSAEGTIKIWDLSKPHKNCIYMKHFRQKIRSKVSHMAWHPTEEFTLAYATEEGRIGILNVTNSSKPPQILPHYFKNSIFSLEWAPLKDNPKKMGLYATGEGNVVVFDVKKEQNDPIVVSLPENTVVYTSFWKPNYSNLFINTKCGNLLSYSPDLELLKTHYLQQKFAKVVWHPSAQNSEEVSENVNSYSNTFAIISNVEGVVVYKLEYNECEVLTKLATLNSGHCELLGSLAWSPFDDHKLVTVGLDGIAQVWNVKTSEILHSIPTIAFSSIYSVLWSPIDPDYIVLGSKDHTLTIVQISKYPPQKLEDLEGMRKQALKAFQTKSPAQKTEKTEEKVTLSTVKPAKLSSLLPVYYTSTTSTETVDNLKKLLNWKLNGTIPLNDNEEKIDLFDALGINDISKLIDLNFKISSGKGKDYQETLLGLMKGDISSVIKKAIEDKAVTPSLLHVAPMVSPKLWQSACEVYAEQLMNKLDAHPFEIATVLLACHKVTETIDMLCSKYFFKEALALAKARSCHDNVVNDIFEKWAKYAIFTGTFEVAAQCYIYLGQFEKAALALFKRTDENLLRFSNELANVSGNTELSTATLERIKSIQLNKEETVDFIMEESPKIIEEIMEETIASEEKQNDSLEKITSEEEGPLDLSIDPKMHNISYNEAIEHALEKKDSPEKENV